MPQPLGTPSSFLLLGCVSPQGSPSGLGPRGPHPHFPDPGSSHLVDGGGAKKNTITFGTLRVQWPSPVPPPARFSHFPGVGAIRAQSSVPPNWRGHIAKHFGFEGAKSGRTDLRGSPWVFCINQCISCSFFSKKK